MGNTVGVFEDPVIVGHDDDASVGAGGSVGSQDWMKAALTARIAGVSHKAMRFVAFEGRDLAPVPDGLPKGVVNVLLAVVDFFTQVMAQRLVKQTSDDEQRLQSRVTELRGVVKADLEKAARLKRTDGRFAPAKTA